MANDFSGDPRVQAIWNFESGALTTDDSGNGNTLTLGAAGAAPTEDTGDYKQGSCCIDFESSSSQYAYITDANLSSNFPLKNGDGGKRITVCCWVKFESLASANRWIWSKYDTNGKRSLGLCVHSSYGFTIYVGYNSGNSDNYWRTGFIPKLDTWYHVTLWSDGGTTSNWLRIYDGDQGGVIFFDRAWQQYTNVEDSNWVIGARWSTSAPTEFHDGKIDELVVFNDFLSESEMDAIIAGTYTYTSLANDFSSDSNCLAVWNFENGAMTTDSQGSNTLVESASAPTSETRLFKQGAGSALLSSAANNYYYIEDADLPAGFPFKDGTSNLQISVCFWFRCNTIISYGRIVAKDYYAGSKRGFEIQTYSDELRLAAGTGASQTPYSLFDGRIVVNHWYHLALAWDATTGAYYAELFNATYGALYTQSGTTRTDTTVNDADWMIGRSGDVSTGTDSTYEFNGYIDELVVFNRIINAQEMYNIRNQVFDGTAAWSPPTSGWYFDPAAFEDGRGDSFDSPYKYAHGKTIGDDEEVFLAETPKVALQGTCTATNGSNSVSTTSDLTSPLQKYSMVQFDDDTEIYMIYSNDGSTINLMGPYRGESGSGKVAQLLVTSTGFWTSYGWTFDSLPVLASTGRRPFIGGLNRSSMEQTGFTLINGAGGQYPWNQTFQNFDLSRICPIYWGYSWGYNSGSFNDCTFDRCYTLRTVTAWSYSSIWRRCYFNKNVSYCGQPLDAVTCFDCTFDDFETHSDDYYGILFNAFLDNVLFRRFKTSCINSSYPGINFYTGAINNVLFIDPVFDELDSGYTNIYMADNGDIGMGDVILKNPQFGSGTLFQTDGSFRWLGNLQLSDVDGDPQKNYEYLGSGEDGKFMLIEPDYSTYRTSPPSIKVNLNTCANSCKKKFFVPVTADEEITISAYLRKNDLYGSDDLPFMRIWYPTGTGTDQVTAEDTQTMEDLDSEWVQVSATITPSISCVIIVAFVFKSSASGAYGRIDDFEVS